MQMQQYMNESWFWILVAVFAVFAVVGLVLFVRARTRPKLPEALRKPTEIPTPLPQRKPTAPEAVTPTAPAPAPVAAPPAPAPALTDEQRVTKGLSRTKTFFQQTFDRLFTGSQAEEFFGDMEEVLLTADIGIDFTERVVADLKDSFGMKLPQRDELRSRLSAILEGQLPKTNGHSDFKGLEDPAAPRPHVVMIIGVNGAGKTTTIAKLCQRYKAQGKKLLVGAADTFRAAAIDQLKTWLDRTGVEGIFQKEGSDPSAVAFDTVQAAVSRKVDVCLIDTAGRLHTKSNLMEELKKMRRVIDKAMPGAPHDVWLVVDGSTGQNALNQAREFHEHLNLSGIIVTKLDGSAKGGAVLAIGAELKVPVVFIGVGEAPEDLVPFQSKTFIDAILEGL